MPRRRTDDNLFENSTMSFGEHLEELRTCLFKSLVGIVVGFCLGLCVGSYVVDFIQSPLKKALGKYYEGQSADRIEAKLSDAKEAEEIKRRIDVDHFLVEEYYVNPDVILRELKTRFPEKFAGFEPPPAQSADGDGENKDNLMPILLWHHTAEDSRVQVKSFNAQEGFVIYVKASLLMGVLLASPYVFYQIWSFVAAGLYPHEKKYVHIFLPVSLGLFFFGVSLAFFFVFEPLLNFLFSMNKSLGIDIDPRISEWLGFVLILPLGFGVSFQLPLVMLFLERIGIFDIHTYLSYFRVAILVIFILAMILTPSPDPYSMLLMAFPLTFLYFAGILLCKLLPRSKSPFDEE